MKWAEECAEWAKIRDELIQKSPNGSVTAYVVTLEQRKRMMVRGDRPMTYDEILVDLERDASVNQSTDRKEK